MKFAILTSDPSSFAHVVTYLSAQDVTCERFDDALALLRTQRAEAFDLLMIDAQLFGTAGQLVLSWRECNADMCWPTLVFGNFVERAEMQAVFDSAVNDLVTGYFTAEELWARVRRVLRCTERGTQRSESTTREVVGPYCLCRLTRTVTLNGMPIRLTAREFATAWLLFSFSGAFLSRQQIATPVWGTDASVSERSIEQHIYKLRKKLCLGEATGVELKTVYSRGYQLAVHEPITLATKTACALQLAA